MMRRNLQKIFLLIVMTILMLACVPTLAPAATPVPTFDPNALGTLIASTANAAVTQTFLFTTPSATPTFTPTPSKTPTETPSPTPTFIFVIVSPTSSNTPTVEAGKPNGKDYVCELLAQSPIDNSLISPGSPFSVRWQIKNAGTFNWFAREIDYRYKNGTKMHNKPAYDLYKDVEPGGTVDIIVDMTSPRTPGIYTTSWRLRMGKTEFCPLSLTINVK